MAGMYHCEIMHPGEISPQTRLDWLTLLAGSQFPSPLLHADFVRLVGEIRADTRVALYRKNERLEAVLPYHARPGGLARPLAAPFSDIQSMLCRDDATLTGAQALELAGLRAYRYEALHDPQGRFDGAAQQDAVHSIVPGDDIEAFLEASRAANPKRHKNHRRLARKLEAEVGTLEFQAGDMNADVFDQLLDWKHDHFARSGKHDVLKADWVGKMMARLFTSGLGDARGLLISLKAGGRLVAGLYGLRVNDAYNPWIASYDPAFSAWSPGQIILHDLVRAMPELGLTRCDLGNGHDHYKKYYANVAIPVVSGLTTAPGRARAITGVRNAVWAMGEAFPVAALAQKAASARRRADQIATTELDFQNRFLGAMGALLPHRVSSGESAA